MSVYTGTHEPLSGVISVLQVSILAPKPARRSRGGAREEPFRMPASPACRPFSGTGERPINI